MKKIGPGLLIFLCILIGLVAAIVTLGLWNGCSSLLDLLTAKY